MKFFLSWQFAVALALAQRELPGLGSLQYHIDALWKQLQSVNTVDNEGDFLREVLSVLTDMTERKKFDVEYDPNCGAGPNFPILVGTIPEVDLTTCTLACLNLGYTCDEVAQIATDTSYDSCRCSVRKTRPGQEDVGKIYDEDLPAGCLYHELTDQSLFNKRVKADVGCDAVGYDVFAPKSCACLPTP